MVSDGAVHGESLVETKREGIDASQGGVLQEGNEQPARRGVRIVVMLDRWKPVVDLKLSLIHI